MLEKNLITGAEIIESRLSVGCFEEAEARTFAVARLEPEALAALAGEGLLLEPAEVVLLCTVEHLGQAVLAYIT